MTIERDTDGAVLWPDRIGNRFRLSEMGDRHLQMAIEKIRRDTWRMEYLVPLLVEQARRRAEREGITP